MKCSKNVLNNNMVDQFGKGVTNTEKILDPIKYY